MYHLRVPQTEEELDLYYQFRWEMLRKPLHQPKGSEREGQIFSGAISNASALNLSPFGQWRLSAFASVEDASPDLRETADSDVPRFFCAAMMSAGCQSGCIILMPPPH
jgi:hypothetical protein